MSGGADVMTGIVWLASYPKSGNTWLRLFLAALAADGGALDINAIGLPTPQLTRRRFAALLDVDASDLTHEEIDAVRPDLCRLDALTGDYRLLRKTHDAWSLSEGGGPAFAADATAGAVYIVRDPRDVAVSMAHHMGLDIDRTIDLMAASDTVLANRIDRLPPLPPQRLLSWSGHVQSWLDAPGLRLLLLRYEDMQADPAATLPEAARFAGLTFTAAAAAAALAATRFDALRRQETEKGFCERSPNADRFFRRGVVGGWRDALTAAQAARIERDHRPVMARLGYR